MLANGEVQMVPCILDQIFQGQRRIEKILAEHTTSLSNLTNETLGLCQSLGNIWAEIEDLKPDEPKAPTFVGGVDVEPIKE